MFELPRPIKIRTPNTVISNKIVNKYLTVFKYIFFLIACLYIYSK